MIFKDNFSATLLIAEQPVIFYAEDKYLIKNLEFHIRFLTVAELFTNPYFQFAIALFNTPLSQLQKSVIGASFESLWDLLQQLQEFQPNCQIMRYIRSLFDAICIEKFTYNSNTKDFKIGDVIITKELFDRIVEVTLIAAGAKDIKEQDKFNAGKPQWLIDKENEIRRIKSQGKQKNAVNELEDLNKTLLPISYELNYSFEQLFNMNYFHIKFLSQNIPKIVQYDIRKHQPLSKQKIKYINEK